MKNVVITGGANGIGRKLVEMFALQNDQVFFIDIDESNGLYVQNSWQRQGKKVFFYHGDIAEQEVLERFMSFVCDKGKVSVFIHNACPHLTGLLNCDYKEFEYAQRVGVVAPFYLTKLCLHHFAMHASVILMVSTRAFMSQANTESYSASKGAAYALTHAMASTLQGIARVNAIAPGWIDTGYLSTEGTCSEEDQKQHYVKRIGNMEDIARAVLFLCDEHNGFINAEVLCVDGGMSKRMIYHGDEGWEYHEGRGKR